MTQPTTTSRGRPLGTRPAGTPLSPVISGTAKIYWVGDSIAHGGSNNSTGNTGLSFRQYIAEMAATSGVAFSAVGDLASAAPSWALHRCIIGQTINTFNTTDFATNTRFTNADPDVVMLCPIGYNDLNTAGDNQTGAQTLTRLTTLLEKIRAFTNARGASPRVVVSYHFRGASANDARIADFNAGLAAVVSTQTGLGQQIIAADPRPWLDGISGAPPFRADGLHPKDIGFRLLADCYFAALMNALGRDAEWGRPTS